MYRTSSQHVLSASVAARRAPSSPSDRLGGRSGTGLHPRRPPPLASRQGKENGVVMRRPCCNGERTLSAKSYLAGP